MKTCTYCGRDNEPTAIECWECGTTFPVPPPPAQPPPLPAQSAAPTQPAGPARTSDLAIASLIMGILSILHFLSSYRHRTFLLAAVGGFIFGIASIVGISQSRGRLKGQGLAIVGLCLSTLFLFCALFLPALAKAKAKAQRIQCVSNLKSLALGLRMYATEHNGRLPEPDKWCDAIASRVGKPKVYRCPAAPQSSRCTYAMNANLMGKNADTINPNTVLLFEIRDGWNVSGGLHLMLTHDPHGRAYNVALVNGSTRMVSREGLRELRWYP